MNIRLVLCFWFFVLPVLAQDTLVGYEIEGESNQEQQEPSGDVVIKGDVTDVISEFRINGQLYMIRITPKKGLPYYLVDSDGDGNLETRWNDLAPNLLIPAWVLLRW